MNRLRESLLVLHVRMIDPGNDVTQDIYKVLAEIIYEIESLRPQREFWTEAVEPDETPTVEQYNDVRDATIRKLRSELAEAKATIDRLNHEVSDAWTKAREHFQSCDEAKADLEGMCERYDALAETLRTMRRNRDDWKRQCEEVERLLAVEREAKDSKCELGELVLGMRRGSSLNHPGLLDGWVALDFVSKRQADNPAEALRAIQELSE